MKKSRNEANKQRRLTVEQLESRTVLSATNLLATTIDFSSHFGERLELSEPSEYVASRIAATDSSFTAIPPLQMSSRLGSSPEAAITQRFQEPLSGSFAERQSLAPIAVLRPSVPFGFVPPASGQPLPVVPLPDVLFPGGAIAAPNIIRPEVAERLEARADLVTLAPLRISTLLDGTTPVTHGPLTHRSELIERRVNEPTSGLFHPPLAGIASGLSEATRFAPNRSANDGLLDFSTMPQFFDANRGRLFAPIGEPGIELLERTSAESIPSLLRLRAGTSSPGRQPQFVASSILATPSSVSADRTTTDLGDGLIDLSAQPRSTLTSPATHPEYGGNDARGGTASQQQHVSKSASLRVGDAQLDSLASILTEAFSDSTLTNRRYGFDSAADRLRAERVAESTDNHGKRRALPDDDGWWSRTTRNSHDSFWLEFGEDIESQLPKEVEEQPSHDVNRLADADTDVDLNEGGLIVLLAASHPGGSKRADPAAHDVPTSNRWPSAGEEVAIDTAVGMFHVFELASRPGEVESKQAVMDGDPPMDATAGTGADEVPPAEQAADNSKDSQSVSVRAASLPALLVVASLLLDRKPQGGKYSTQMNRKLR